MAILNILLYPTSHNLLPFELIVWVLFGSIVLGIVSAVRLYVQKKQKMKVFMENCAEQPNKALVSDLSGKINAAPRCGSRPQLGVISNRMKIVYRARDITEAEIVKGMLLSNEIEAHVSGYFLQGGIGEIAPTDLAKVHDGRRRLRKGERNNRRI
ncbi:putative signal transducing protein [Candidatus Reidiella endopervernicosa]|uniref:putative signal transducing protein n=1 Tax=Candidatus Reidiella endopervernicosa TaxID=2738883 RepID=UPI001F32B335|nr:DUF2007 domain-containing protein [Candidatus Reidiella endopervernicosa]